jgi:hypothetical protein
MTLRFGGIATPSLAFGCEEARKDSHPERAPYVILNAVKDPPTGSASDDLKERA